MAVRRQRVKISFPVHFIIIIIFIYCNWVVTRGSGFLTQIRNMKFVFCESGDKTCQPILVHFNEQFGPVALVPDVNLTQRCVKIVRVVELLSISRTKTNFVSSERLSSVR
jgi:hypothetical protein